MQAFVLLLGLWGSAIAIVFDRPVLALLFLAYGVVMSLALRAARSRWD